MLVRISLDWRASPACAASSLLRVALNWIRAAMVLSGFREKDGKQRGPSGRCVALYEWRSAGCGWPSLSGGFRKKDLARMVAKSRCIGGAPGTIGKEYS